MGNSAKYIIVLVTALASLCQAGLVNGQELLALGKREKNAEIQTLNPKARKWLYPVNEEQKKKEQKKFDKYAAKAVGSYTRIDDKSFKVVWPEDEIKKGDILYDLEVYFDKPLKLDGIVTIIKKHSLELYHLRESDSKAFVKIPDSRSYREVLIELAEENDILHAKPNSSLDLDAKPRRDILSVSKILDLTVKPGITPEDVDSLCRQYNVRSLYRLNERIMRRDPNATYKGPELYLRRYTLEILDDVSTVRKKAIIMRDPRVESVSGRGDGPVELNGEYIPNDPRYNEQWHLRDVGFPWFWPNNSGVNTDTIAILDSGFRLDHFDLNGRSIDPYDWVNLDPDPEEIIIPGYKPYGHGTLVAGVAGAVSNNGTDVTGITWNTSLMLYKVLYDSAGLLKWDNDALCAALCWAADNGAKVINISITRYGNLFYDVDQFNDFKAAIEYAISNDVIIVTSAGNDGYPISHYPGGDFVTYYFPQCFDYQGLLAVAGTNSEGNPWSSTMYGPAVEISAPAEDILTIRGDINNGCITTGGTSFASPIVAGVVSLLRTKYPSESNIQIIDRLKYAVEPIVGNPTGMGWGRINAFMLFDDSSPIVIGHQPANYSSGIEIDANVVIEFDEPIDTTSVKQYFQLNPYISGKFTWNADRTIVTFNPDGDFSYNTTYTVNLPTSIQNLAKINLNSSVSWSFTTVPVPPPPEIYCFRVENGNRYPSNAVGLPFVVRQDQEDGISDNSVTISFDANLRNIVDNKLKLLFFLADRNWNYDVNQPTHTYDIYESQLLNSTATTFEKTYSKDFPSFPVTLDSSGNYVAMLVHPISQTTCAQALFIVVDAVCEIEDIIIDEASSADLIKSTIRVPTGTIYKDKIQSVSFFQDRKFHTPHVTVPNSTTDTSFTIGDSIYAHRIQPGTENRQLSLNLFFPYCDTIIDYLRPEWAVPSSDMNGSGVFVNPSGEINQITFRYIDIEDSVGSGKIFLAGAFNHWRMVNMVRIGTSDTFEVTLPIKNGEWDYTYVVNDDWNKVNGGNIGTTTHDYHTLIYYKNNSWENDRIIGMSGEIPLIGLDNPHIFHQPITNTTNTTSEYIVTADITDDSGINIAYVYYSINSSPACSVAMTSNESTFIGLIPAQPVGTIIKYCIRAWDLDDQQATYPYGADPYTFAGAISFSIIADTQPPSLVWVSPRSNALNVPCNTNIVVSFSEGMFRYSVQSSFLYGWGETQYDGSCGIWYWYNDTTASFSPSYQFPFDTSCFCNISIGARDIAGNYLSSPFNWTFKTIKQIHDLAVEDIHLSNPWPGPLVVDTILVTVANVGNQPDSGAYVEVSIDETFFTSSDTFSLNPSERKILSFPWVPDTIKGYTLKAEVKGVPNDTIIANNIKSKFVITGFISETRPMNNEKAVPCTTSVEIFFTTPIDTVQVRDYFSIYPTIPMNYTWKDEQKHLILSHTTNFTAGTNYTIKLLSGLRTQQGFVLPNDIYLLFTTNADSLSSIASGYDPMWSPDGSRLVYSKKGSYYINGVWRKIWTINVKNLINNYESIIVGDITKPNTDCFRFPCWSPNGNLISFSQYFDFYNPKNALRVKNIATGDINTLIEAEYDLDPPVTWLPNTYELIGLDMNGLFSICSDGSNRDVYYGERIYGVSACPVTDEANYFYQTIAGFMNNDLVLLRKNTIKYLGIKEYSPINVCWSPTGEKLLYTDEYNLFIYENLKDIAKGFSLIPRVTKTSIVNAVSWSLYSNDYRFVSIHNPSWSPDGRKVAFNASITGPNPPYYDEIWQYKIPYLPEVSFTKEDITVKPIVEQSLISITAKIHNDGKQAAQNVLVSFFDGLPISSGINKIGEEYIATIPVDSFSSVSVNWVAHHVTPGVHEIYVIADPANNINEIDKHNNQAIGNVTIITAEPPRVTNQNFTPLYFSPNDDGINDSTRLSFAVNDNYSTRLDVVAKIFDSPEINTAHIIKSLGRWTMTIQEPFNVVWDGRSDWDSLVTCGTYWAQITAIDDAGLVGTGLAQVVMDNIPPTVSTPEVPPFSPLMQPQIHLECLIESDEPSDPNATFTVVVDIYHGNTCDSTDIIKSFSQMTQIMIGPVGVDWNGRDDRDSLVGDGIYTCCFKIIDRAGNATIAKIPVHVDSSPAVMSSITFSPNPITSREDSITVEYNISEDANIFISFTGLSDTIHKTSVGYYDFNNDSLQDVNFCRWDGKDNIGINPVPDGNYQINLYAIDMAGNISDTIVLYPDLTIDRTAPKLSYLLTQPSCFNSSIDTLSLHYQVSDISDNIYIRRISMRDMSGAIKYEFEDFPGDTAGGVYQIPRPRRDPGCRLGSSQRWISYLYHDGR